ncbi:purine-nucleoside phosphorylase [Buchnera aphidicola]|uniref:Purine nucleoside phosphorylase DeoD-type n=1 Tax=Buchnera aphidicola str. USDA (Myzus persicae) TaxID=1009856 RepID=W0P339_BUCMP|nr:purine-nucleoside phosphorylase [Buchnera aphidicola]AHG59862.1 Deod [Buchnera aphidicola str. USDA (Myzus persicae)]AHG60442.1 Deod [Buchnera aphidicola str. W106 (Myzus persicae)]AHG61015.1 Deod [Buchnera aphidicola str. G002 (Myzus persicae)]AHG61587.1 Deod [Buchnera aphidicola str. F009 (Myzus persicae)]WAI02898.1 MAG: purine-nucleoside phosphorylase [Buchnera aphidicola (Myzus persicae)]
MPTPHIDSKKNDFSDIVLMPGDPVRAKYIAEKYLDDCIQINKTRLMLAYTGFFKNKKISVMSHGIGIPSASLYVRELILEYNVKKIIRIGTCGTLRDDISLRDVVICMGASTDSKFNRIKFNNHDFSAIADFDMICQAVEVIKKMKIKVCVGNFFTTDSFYNDDKKMLDILKKYNILAIDMETSGIYGVAAELKAKALSICTVSDHILNGESLSSKDRELSFNNMIKIALESALLIK